jgi:ankyrin repeat protein
MEQVYDFENNRDTISDVNMRNKGETMALHCAAQKGDKEMVQLLLDYGANANLRDMKGKTAIDRAMEKSFEKCAWLMIKHQNTDKSGSIGANYLYRHFETITKLIT